MITHDEMYNFEDLYADEETLNIVLGGLNAVDLPKLNTTDQESARNLLVNYGFDPEISDQHRALEKLRFDAVHFIEKRLLQDPDNPSERMEIPEYIRFERDVTRLMVMASTNENGHGRWACAILRIMHTLTHISNDLSTNFFPSIQKIILDRVLDFVHTDPAGDVYLGTDENGIRLYMLDIKTQKSFDSLLLKLLHKSDNVGADIFDRIGFRFVTFSKFEALQALKYLRKHIFAFPNIKTSRTRNTLIDIPRYHQALNKLLEQHKQGLMSAEDVRQLAINLAESNEFHPQIDKAELRERNVYSSTEYTSLQMTCRQLIRVQGPPISSFSPDVKDGLVEYRFFFPYELQILDKSSYIESRRGRASHAEYKRSQLRAARKRIFPWLERSGTKRK